MLLHYIQGILFCLKYLNKNGVKPNDNATGEPRCKCWFGSGAQLSRKKNQELDLGQTQLKVDLLVRQR